MMIIIIMFIIIYDLAVGLQDEEGVVWRPGDAGDAVALPHKRAQGMPCSKIQLTGA